MIASLPHRRVALAHAERLRGRDDIRAVLLGGSVARGNHCASSDIDLLIVGPEVDELQVRVMDGELLVERISHSEPQWRLRLDRPRTSWLYALLDAEVLYDDGSAARLREASAATLRTYRASPELRERLATMLWHGQAKLARAADDRSRGLWSALFVETILDGLYTVYDIPLPAGARRLEHLHLVPLDTTEQALVTDLLTGDTDRRFAATTELTADLRSRLGPADHERP